MIKIDFEMTSDNGAWIYRDALHLPDDHTYTEADIEVMKQARFARWLEVITAPPVIVEETPVDVLPDEPSVEDIPVQE